MYNYEKIFIYMCIYIFFYFLKDISVYCFGRKMVVIEYCKLLGCMDKFCIYL